MIVSDNGVKVHSLDLVWEYYYWRKTVCMVTIITI